jgi:alkylated DNA nucleotide flippase Atl1
VTSIDFERAKAFVEAIPAGRWTSYKDVAAAAGSPQGAQAVGQWLRRNGDTIANVYRVLTVDGHVADGFVPAGRGVPDGEVQVRRTLRSEGVRIDDRGRAAPSQRFGAEGWRG